VGSAGILKEEDMHPNWPHDQVQPAPPPAAVTIPSHLGRQRATWAQLAPYLVACVAVALAVATMTLTLTWRTAMQAQVSQLRHELAGTQSQLSAAVGSGQSQITRLSGRVSTLGTAMDAITGRLAPYAATCVTDATAPSGPVAASFLCRP
jgi:hypothetical protein